MAEAKSVQARFIGDPMHPDEPVPDVLDAFGTTFEKDKFTEVAAEHADKVRGNSHFEVKGEKKAKAPERTAEGEAEFAARVNEIKDRAYLEEMLEAEKRPAAKEAIEARIAALPAE